MKKAKRLGNNIFCIEGDWEEDLRNKTSILSGLEMLSSISEMDFIHRTCSTPEDLSYRLKDFVKNSKNSRSKYQNYDILYLASHGTKGNLCFSKNVNILEWFTKSAHFKKNDFENKIIHFGSCSTLKIEDSELLYFKKHTGAKIISGFKKNINFLESTVFEILYFNACKGYERAGSLNNHLFKQYKVLYEDLGFVMV